MKRTLFLAALTSGIGVAALPGTAGAQKALVYCAPNDYANCNTVVAALSATGSGFTQVDRGYDGSGTTIDIADAAVVSTYSVFFVPSHGNPAGQNPSSYARLRNATVQSQLRTVLTGNVAIFSGTPDAGLNNRDHRDQTIRNLAAWARSATGKQPGLVVLQDFSTDATRYGWLNGVASVSVSAANATQTMSPSWNWSQITFAGTDAGNDIKGTIGNYNNAAFVGLTSPSTGGVVTASATNPSAGNILVTFTRTPGSAVQSQTISFTAPSGLKYGGADVDLGATASSNLPVSYSSSTTNVCTIVDSKLRIVAAGNCTVTASQPGGSGYSAAADVTHTFAIAKADQTIAFNVPAGLSKSFGDADFTIASYASAGSGLPVAFESATPAVCAVAVDGTVTIRGAGTCTIRAAQDGNDNYNAAPSVTQDVGISQAAQSIDFAEIAGKTYGDADFAVSATASSNLDVTFTTEPSSVCTISGSTVSIRGVGACTITASQSGNGNYQAAQDVSRSFTVSPKQATVALDNLEQVYNGQPREVTVTTTPTGLSVEITYDGSTTPPTAVGEYAVVATITDANHTGTVAGTLKITKAQVAFTISNASHTYDGTPKAVSVTADPSGVAATIEYRDANGNVVASPRRAGSYTVTVNSGDANYEGGATRSLVIAPKPITGSFTAEDKEYDGTTTATVGGFSLDGKVGSDDVALSVSAASFDSKDAGTNKTVTAVLSLTGTDASNYTVNTPGTTRANITPKPLTASISANDKTYDGTTDAQISLDALSGVIDGDVVNLGYTSASFDTKNVGAGKTVTATGLSLTGAAAGNYSLISTSATATAAITPKELTGSFTVSSKVYDGTTAATVAGTSLPGVISPDVVTLNVTGAEFGDKNVGDGKMVSASFSLGGADAGNYNLSSYSGTATASITPLGITGSFTAANKVYDGNNTATITDRALNGAISGDDVSLTGGTATFADKHAGNGKTVTGLGFALSGTDGGNYTLGSVPTTTANITARTLNVTATAQSREYDGTTAATVNVSDDRVAGDALTLAYSAAFADKNVGTGKTVTVSGISISGGADAGNYTLGNTSTAATANITAKTLTGSFTASDKVYDGTTIATVAGTSLPGVITGDAITLEVANAAFDNKNVGTSKSVTADLSLSGGDASNYLLSSNSAATTANITALGITGSFTAESKVYDATTTANVLGRSLIGAISGDDVSLSGGTASFDDKNVGTGKTVTLTGASLTGTDAGNYSLTSVGTATADIMARGLTVSATGVSKVYDGTAAATVTLSDNRVGDDALTLGYASASFADANVGTAKLVSVSGITVTGTDADNYTFNQTASTTADITPRPVTVTADAKNKVYGDADPALTYQVTSGSLVAGEGFTGALTRSAGENVGSYAIGQGILALSSNYALTYVGANLTITARPLTITADAKSKVFGEADPPLTWRLTAGNLVGTDQITGVLSRDAGELVGSYPIRQGSLTAGANYGITYVGADLTIGSWTARGFHQPIGIPNSGFAPANPATGQSPTLPQPNAGTVWQVAKGGSAIPLKFNVFAGDAERTSVADLQKWDATKLSTCTVGAGDDGIEELSPAGATTMRYDGVAGSGQFIYNWKTASVKDDTCYRVAVTLKDNSVLYTFVKLRK